MGESQRVLSHRELEYYGSQRHSNFGCTCDLDTTFPPFFSPIPFSRGVLICRCHAKVDTNGNIVVIRYGAELASHSKLADMMKSSSMVMFQEDYILPF